MGPYRHSDLNEGVGVENIVNRPEAMMAASSNYRMNVQAADGEMQRNPNHQVNMVQTRSGASDELSRDRFTQEQVADPVLNVVRKWLESNERPSWSTISPECADVKFYWSRWENMVIQDDVLCYKRYIDTDAYQALIIVPDKLRSAVLTQLHNVPTAAHLSVKKTYEKVKQRFYWLKI